MGQWGSMTTTSFTDYSQIHISKSQSQLRLHNILDDAILF